MAPNGELAQWKINPSCLGFPPSRVYVRALLYTTTAQHYAYR
jgi:hypothetical protein